MAKVWTARCCPITAGLRVRLEAQKTDRSERTVTISEDLHKILVDVVDPSKVDVPVFTSPMGRRLNKRNFARRQFKAAAREADIEDVIPHDLRRTCGSWLVQNGVPLFEVSRMLGHSSTRVTEKVYAHLLDNSNAVTQLDAARRARREEEVAA